MNPILEGLSLLGNARVIRAGQKVPRRRCCICNGAISFVRFCVQQGWLACDARPLSFRLLLFYSPEFGLQSRITDHTYFIYTCIYYVIHTLVNLTNQDVPLSVHFSFKSLKQPCNWDKLLSQFFSLSFCLKIFQNFVRNIFFRPLWLIGLPKRNKFPQVLPFLE